MVNTPPTKKWHKWFYRISFFALGLMAIALTCLQYKGEEEKSKQTYDNFANVISNEAAIRQSVDESKTNIQLTVGFPAFEIFCNGSLITNGSVIRLNTQREIAMEIYNVGEVTAENTSISFSAKINTTNLIADGWNWQPAGLETIKDGKIVIHDYDLNQWLWKADISIESKSQFFHVAELRISTNEPSFFGWTIIRIYADRSKQQDFNVFLISEK